MSDCGFISEAWTCVKSEGHAGGHVYELRSVSPESKAIAAAEERGRRAVFADPEALARRFHETYERLAPEHGYETRKDSAVPWEKVPEKNRRLMIAVCAALAPRDSGKEPAKMDAPDGPQCWCGMPSTRENGWCGTCNFAKDRK